MVNVGGKGHHNRRSNTLLKNAAKLALGVDLSSESRHAEVVLGTNGSDTLLLQTTTHHAAGRGDEAEAQINTSLDLIGEPSPVRGVESSHGSLELSGGNPVVRLITGSVRNSALGALGEGRSLPESLKTKGELGGDGLEVAANEDTSESALEVGGVEHLKGCAKVVAGVLVLELRHILTTRRDGELRLGDKLVGPSPVESPGESALIVEVSLAEDLVMG